MPCVTPLANGRELEFGWVSEFLKEVSGGTPSYSQVDYNYYGVRATYLNERTDELCRALRELSEEKIAKMSPQLRYWWKRHQMHDELRAFRKELGLEHKAIPEGF